MFFCIDYYLSYALKARLFYLGDPCGQDPKPCNDEEDCVLIDKAPGYQCQCKMGYQGDCNECEGNNIHNSMQDFYQYNVNYYNLVIDFILLES